MGNLVKWLWVGQKLLNWVATLGEEEGIFLKGFLGFIYNVVKIKPLASKVFRVFHVFVADGWANLGQSFDDGDDFVVPVALAKGLNVVIMLGSFWGLA